MSEQLREVLELTHVVGGVLGQRMGFGEGGWVRGGDGTIAFVSGQGGFVPNIDNADGTGGLVRWQPGRGHLEPGPTPGVGGKFHWVPGSD
jgi:hypothetical protein